MMNIALASEKTDFNALIAAIPPTKNHALLFQNLVKINQDLVFPSNFQVQFTGNGAFEIASGKTVTIKGAVAAQPMNIFRGAGKVLLENSPLANIFPQWWGAVGDWTSGTTGTDNVAAFLKMQESLGASSNGARVLIPSGGYFFSGQLVITRPISMIGGTVGLTSNVLLVFGNSSKGVEVSSNATGTLLKGVHVRTAGDNGTSAGTNHGINIKSKASVEKCFVSGFNGDGIKIEGNAPLWQIKDVSCKRNGKNGLHVNGANASAGTAIGLDCQNNLENGIHDNGTTGNTYIGCLSNNNSASFENYKVTGASNDSVFVGCYEAGNIRIDNSIRVKDEAGGNWRFSNDTTNHLLGWDLGGAFQAYGFTNSAHSNPGHMMLLNPMANSKHWYSAVKQNGVFNLNSGSTATLTFTFNNATFFSSKSDIHFVATIELRTSRSNVDISQQSYSSSTYTVKVSVRNTDASQVTIQAGEIKVAGFFIATDQ